jgi:hypothetical protein
MSDTQKERLTRLTDDILSKLAQYKRSKYERRSMNQDNYSEPHPDLAAWNAWLETEGGQNCVKDIDEELEGRLFTAFLVGRRTAQHEHNKLQRLLDERNG